MANVVGYSRAISLLFLFLSNVSVLINAAATPIRATALEKRAGEKIQIFDLENVCRISGATSVMINNTMWINGGDITMCYSPTNCSTWSDISNYVISVPFDKAYANVQFANIDYKAMIKPRDVPVSTRGVLWRNGEGSKLFQFAGRITNNDSSPIQNASADSTQLWSYTIATDTWEYLSKALSPSWDLYQVSVPEKDTAYSFGSIGGLPYKWDSVVLQLNSTLEEDVRLETTNTPPGDQDRGGMVYLPVPGSEEGLLLVTGGSHSTEDGSEPDVSLEYVMLYDIKTKTWYNQSTSTDGPGGAYPNPRHNYCAQIVSTGNDSWDIFMYGGDYSDVYDKSTLQGLWILSIPTFRWFYFTNPSSAVPLAGTTCQVIGPHFIVFGGWTYWNVSPAAGPNCTEPFRIFNLNEWNWTNAFDPNASYSAPASVADYKAANQAPIGGWNSGVQALFAGLNSSSTESSNSTSSSPPAATSTAEAESSSSNLGSILGGVLGGLAGIGAVLVGILMLIRRKKRAMAAGGEVTHEIGDETKIYVEMPAPYIAQQPPSELLGDVGHYGPAGPPAGEPGELVGGIPADPVKIDSSAGVR